MKRNASFLASAVAVMLTLWAAVFAACALPYLAR